MLAPKARWSIGNADEMLIETFVRELQIDPLVARLLVLRDIRTVPEAEQFMHGEFSTIMIHICSTACSRLLNAFEKHFRTMNLFAYMGTMMQTA